MPILKNKQIIADNWRYIADDMPLFDGDITISVRHWLKNKQQLAKHNGRLGLRLISTDNLADISCDLAHFDLIEIEFSAFTDGRGFSMAKLLKSRFYFNGELRATGNFMRDQIFYLARVGIDSFSLGDSIDIESAITALDEFTVYYQ